MYLGHLTMFKAQKEHLWRLTTWDPPRRCFNTIHETPHSRILVSRTCADWCEEEAKRIGLDPRRKAAVVELKSRSTIAVFVDLVAGDGHEDSEPDEVGG
jgi:hypothetical protein